MTFDLSLPDFLLFAFSGVVCGLTNTLAGNGSLITLPVFIFIGGLPALAVFVYYGQVHLIYGLLMAVFQSIGAWLALQFAARTPDANMWIHRLLLAVVAVSALKFF